MRREVTSQDARRAGGAVIAVNQTGGASAVAVQREAAVPSPTANEQQVTDAVEVPSAGLGIVVGDRPHLHTN